MINRLEQLQNFQDSVESRDALDRLRALQYMQAQSQGLMGLPVVQRYGGGGAVGAGGGGTSSYVNPPRIPHTPIPNQTQIIEQPEENTVNIPIAAQGNLELNTASITPTEVAPQIMAAPEAPIEAIGPTGQELPSPTGLAGGGQIAEEAQGLASLGRHGDNMLLHVNPEELEGLSSLMNITYNPITGLPEAFGGFRSIARAVRRIAKPIRKLAPVLLTMAAPALFGGLGLGFGGGALGLGIQTALGSSLGNIIAGAKPGDALKQGAMSGLVSGGIAGLTGTPLLSKTIPTTVPTKGTTVLQTGLGQTADIAKSGVGASGSQFGVSSLSKASPSILQNIKQSPLVQDPMGTLKNIGSGLGQELMTTKGLAKAAMIDLGTPDWEAQYAAEAAAKNQQLQAAGYTVDTGFDGQTVIRDSSGVVMPRNLTVQQILDRALGKQQRTRLVERYGYAPTTAKQGGLISLAGGGEFSGQVEGQGHGIEDNVFMPIKEKGEQIGTLAVSPAEYVVDAHTMSALGNGNADQGAKVMDGVVESVRKKAYGTIRQPKEIDGLQALKPLMERV